LEKLLIRFEVNDLFFSRFEIQKIEENAKGWRLKAKVHGEPFDPERHKQKVGIKAVTYHRMEIQEAPAAVTLKFILDI
jgi:SHS2 domain-containing protein